jgi:hypothetical protein
VRVGCGRVRRCGHVRIGCGRVRGCGKVRVTGHFRVGCGRVRRCGKVRIGCGRVRRCGKVRIGHGRVRICGRRRRRHGRVVVVRVVGGRRIRYRRTESGELVELTAAECAQEDANPSPVEGTPEAAQICENNENTEN